MPEPEKTDDFEKWKERDLWTLSEAACIVCGYSPGSGFFSEEPRNVQDIFESADMSIIAGTLQTATTEDGEEKYVKPAKFITWAHGKGYPIPDELQDMIETGENESEQNSADEKPGKFNQDHIEKAVNAGIFAAEHLQENQSPMKKADLMQKLNMSDSKTFRAIWGAIPEKYKKGHGRPKKH